MLGDAHLAPVYDLVTTTVYLPKDRMALTLNGDNRWPTGSELVRFGEGRSIDSRRNLQMILERIADALSVTANDVREYMKGHPAFAEVGDAMLVEWAVGVKAMQG